MDPTTCARKLIGGGGWAHVAFAPLRTSLFSEASFR